MWDKKMPASISMDTSILEEKIHMLLEVLPEHIPDKLLDMVTGLLSNIVFMNFPSTVSTGGTFDIVCVLDFDATAYSQIMSAARAFKTNLAHE